MIIAVDGPAAAGKGTLARALAAHFGFHFLDTGSLYRMVALAVLSRGARPARPAGGDRGGTRTSIPDPSMRRPCAMKKSARRLRSSRRFPRFARPCSICSAPLRRAKPGAVLDGRDIGTVVCPERGSQDFRHRHRRRSAREAPHESSLRSAARRFAYEAVLADIHERDARDRTRSFAPLVPAADAYRSRHDQS